VWIAASVVLALSDPDRTWGLALRVVATVALSWWAVDEIVQRSTVRGPGASGYRSVTRSSG
jgi:hypothetical protein